MADRQESQSASSSEPLCTWSEIKGYLKQHLGQLSEPTLRKLRDEEGLPVKRISGGPKGRVIAYRDEIDKWIEQRTATQPTTRPTRTRFRRQTLTKAATVVAVLAGVALVAVVVYREYQRPTEYSIDGNTLKASNRNGVTVWQKKFTSLHPSLTDPQADMQAMLLLNIDDDRYDEILFNYSPRDLTSGGGSLVALDTDGSTLWEFRYGRDLDVGDRAFGSYFGEATLEVVPGPRGPLILVASHHHSFYPTQVALVNPSSGQLVSEYWHPGWIYSTALADTDSDGSDELLLGGINNPDEGYGHPSLAVLDIPFTETRGCGRTGNPFGPTNCLEVEYILFPLPDVFPAAGSGASINAISPQDDGRLLLKIVGTEVGVHAFYFLTRDLEPIEVRPADWMKSRHEQLRRAGLLDHTLDEREWDRWLDFERFETAPHGNSQEIAALFKLE